MGWSSPIVWGDRIFLTGADARREEVYCIDAASGAMVWKKGLVVIGPRTDPPEPNSPRLTPMTIAPGHASTVDISGPRVAYSASIGTLK